MKQLPLGRTGLVALVDDDVHPFVCEQRWSPLRGARITYARSIDTGWLLHHAVMDLCDTDGPLVDHVDHDGLNNQRRNLRPATVAQNAWNSRRAVGASGHPGVSRNRSGWAVRFEHEGTTQYFGTHRNLDTAKQIANYEMWRLRGEFLPARHPARLAAEAQQLRARLAEIERGGLAA